MRICVFCGSKKGNRPEYEQAARDVGRLFAERKIGLVYGGGHIGLMGVAADVALQAGGEVIGVIPHSMVERELAHERLTELHIVETMHQRKALMADKADAFLALPGGFGTMEELFEVVSWRQLKMHAKPIGLLNVAGFYDPLVAWIETAFREGFISPKHHGLILAASRSDQLIAELSQRQELTPPFALATR
jgi:uncharacterized protein (TIGR00730 family)